MCRRLSGHAILCSQGKWGRGGQPSTLFPGTGLLHEYIGQKQVCILFAWADPMMKFCKNLAGPWPAPAYLPTYPPYLWETKKEITRRVKVGYYTN